MTLVILCNPGEGEGLKERLERWLTRCGLVLNERKTRVIESRESGFEFLGFAFRLAADKEGHALRTCGTGLPRNAGTKRPRACFDAANEHLER